MSSWGHIDPQIYSKAFTGARASTLCSLRLHPRAPLNAVYTPTGQPRGHGLAWLAPRGRPLSVTGKRSALNLTEVDAPKTTAHVLMPAHSAAVEPPIQPPTAHFTVPPLEKRSKHPTAYAMAHTTPHSILTSYSPQHCTNASPTLN